MNWYIFTGIASTTILFIPALLIAFFKLYKNISLLILCLYYTASGVYNLMHQGYIPVLPASRNFFGILLNYLDAPMMLVVLLFFCTVPLKKKLIYFSIALFICYELIILAAFRFSTISSIYILGPGILLILVYSIYLFIQFGKTTVMYGKGLGHTLMLVSIAFSYGCFSFIYFLHYIQKTSASADVFLIYYIVLIISSAALSIGLVWLRKRMKDIKEVQITRKELAQFFEV